MIVDSLLILGVIQSRGSQRWQNKCGMDVDEEENKSEIKAYSDSEARTTRQLDHLLR